MLFLTVWTKQSWQTSWTMSARWSRPLHLSEIAAKVSGALAAGADRRRYPADLLAWPRRSPPTCSQSTATSTCGCNTNAQAIPPRTPGDRHRGIRRHGAVGRPDLRRRCLARSAWLACGLSRPAAGPVPDVLAGEVITAAMSLLATRGRAHHRPAQLPGRRAQHASVHHQLSVGPRPGPALRTVGT